MPDTPPDHRSTARFGLGAAVVGIMAMIATAACHAPIPDAADCPLARHDNYWHADVSSLPVHARSDAWVAAIGTDDTVHPDFGAGLWDGGPIGIPFTTVGDDQPLVDVAFDYDDESDPGPYPIPPDAPIEGGSGASGDRHVIVVDRDACTLYETWNSWPQPDGTWGAGSGAVFDLRSNDFRPDGWTSADAAGLPILPGLVRYEDVARGHLSHAIRFTAPVTQRAYVWPARHQAGSTTDPDVPPMGAWFRLKSTIDPGDFDPQVAPIIEAMQTHGLILADNGSPWYLSGAPSEDWDNDALRDLRDLTGADFEAVDVSGLIIDPDSGQIPT